MTSLVRMVAFMLALIGVNAAHAAATCTSADIAAAVDQSGAELRAFTAEVQPKIQDRLRRYRDAKKMPEAGFESAALDAVQDSKLDAFDAKSSDLLLKVDSLGRVEDGTALDCARISEIKATSGVLLSVMREKSDYMIARLDSQITSAGAAQSKAATAEPPKPAAKAKPDTKATGPAAGPQSNWAANTKPNDAYKPPPPATGAPPAAAAAAATEDGYSIDEVREATRGFFGTISTNLASVIEHAFKQSGRPTAYVLGSEGGGAFLAGLRYGKGTLYMRNQAATQDVYWHGPSLGTDFGASGSRTMFLIYKLQDPAALYRSFTGVDGSAYFVGGVGITFLKGGDVLMAPIRSGLGFRVGANIGYVRFTSTATWNPF